MNRLIHFQRTNLLFLITLLVACFVLPRRAQAVSPAPDGGYARGNTAEGENALFDLTTGANNTANGLSTLFRNTTGNDNTAVGFQALLTNTTGNYNTALGRDAGTNVSTANHVTCIGATVAGANVSNTTWIASVYGVTTITGGNLPVVVSPYGQLGTTASARRFKKDIETMARASEAILALKPVTFHYKNDTNGVPQFGLVAEDVAKVNPDLVVNDRDGKPYTVRYDAVNAMLLNEFLKEHNTVQELKKEIATLTATVKEQAAQIEKVSAQIQVTNPAPQVVGNSQ